MNQPSSQGPSDEPGQPPPHVSWPVVLAWLGAMFGGIINFTVIGTSMALLYALFFSWYTSFGGPLSQAEIAHFSQVLEDVASPPERMRTWVAFMESDTGDDFAMLTARVLPLIARVLPLIARVSAK